MANTAIMVSASWTSVYKYWFGLKVISCVYARVTKNDSLCVKHSGKEANIQFLPHHLVFFLAFVACLEVTHTIIVKNLQPCLGFLASLLLNGVSVVAFSQKASLLLLFLLALKTSA